MAEVERLRGENTLLRQELGSNKGTADNGGGRTYSLTDEPGQLQAVLKENRQLQEKVNTL